MPLEQEIRNAIEAYCRRDLPGDLQWHIDQFGFVADVELRKRLGRAFYAARYMGKLMEATYASGDAVHAFVKFQIMQYASIYEAVISHLLWSVYSAHAEVAALQTHKSYKPVSALGSNTQMTYGSEPVFQCVYRDTKTPKNSIPFRDKVDCAVRIGFVEAAFAGDIKRTYELRNLAHIETEAEKQIEVEIEQSRQAFWRMKPFLDRIAEALKPPFTA